VQPKTESTDVVLGENNQEYHLKEGKGPERKNSRTTKADSNQSSTEDMSNFTGEAVSLS